STAGEIKLSQTSGSWTETSDTDFNTGTKDNIAVSGTGDVADLTLLPGNTATTDSFTDTSKIASSSNMNFDTANGQVKLVTSTSTLILKPNGAGDYTQLSQYPATGSNWDKVDDGVSPDMTPDDATTYVNGLDGSADVYALENHTTQSGSIQQVKIYFRILANNEAGGMTPRFQIGTNEVNGTEAISISWTSFSQILSRPGGGNWNWTDIDNLQAGMVSNGIGEASGDGQLTQLYVEVTYIGAFTSTNLLSGQTVGPIDSFSYNLTALPTGTTAQVSFSQDNTNWYNSAGTTNEWNTMSAGNNEIDLSALSWTGANFYYKMEWTSDGTDMPVLDSVSVHTNYPSTGNLISSIKDTGKADPDFTTVTWNETLNTYGDVDLKVRSSDNADMAGATAWGNIAVIESGGGDISGIGNGQYVQYQAILSTTNQTITPQLHDVTINYGITSTLTSSPYDASDSGQVINQIVWTETAPTNTNVKFQMRTAPESSGTYTIWMGPDGTADTYFDNDSSGCSKTGSDVTCDVLNTLGISDGVNDRWMQYKVWLTTSVAETPVLQNVSVQYVVNATPVVSNVTASQGTDGVVSISYDLSDADSSSFTVSALADIGVTLNEELTSSDVTAITVSDASLLPASGTIQIDNEQISYTSKSGNDLQGTITRGANNTKALSHSSTTAVWIKGSTVSGDVGASQTAGTGKS
ncbi:MAG: hypothetical protein KAS78_04890, partial [Candidatus Pacebacteria bacterium]|nr:hypothetical protein [Candidatus Paceibacterota bacterium]